MFLLSQISSYEIQSHSRSLLFDIKRMQRSSGNEAVHIFIVAETEKTSFPKLLQTFCVFRFKNLAKISFQECVSGFERFLRIEKL